MSCYPAEVLSVVKLLIIKYFICYVRQLCLSKRRNPYYAYDTIRTMDATKIRRKRLFIE